MPKNLTCYSSQQLNKNLNSLLDSIFLKFSHVFDLLYKLYIFFCIDAFGV